MTEQYRLNSIVQFHDEDTPVFMTITYISEYGEVGLKGLGNNYLFGYQKGNFQKDLLEGIISIASY